VGILTNDAPTYDPNEMCPTWCEDHGRHQHMQLGDGQLHYAPPFTLPITGLSAADSNLVKIQRFRWQPDENTPCAYERFELSIAGDGVVEPTAAEFRLLATAMLHYADELENG
jgi:hypothetical protein